MIKERNYLISFTKRQLQEINLLIVNSGAGEPDLEEARLRIGRKLDAIHRGYAQDTQGRLG